MPPLISYQTEEAFALITMDDGKVNALSLEMLQEIGGALDRAEQEGLVVVLSGRDGLFSAGFDLTTLRAGGERAEAMLRAGFQLAHRLLGFPAPVVIACTGHAVAMGVFLLLSGDYRIGAEGSFKITANEVAIGLTMPEAAVEICRQRLNPVHFTRVVLLSDSYDSAGALEAGFLDRVVPSEELGTAVAETARSLATLDRRAHAASKLRARGSALETIAAAIGTEFGPATS